MCVVVVRGHASGRRQRAVATLGRGVQLSGEDGGGQRLSVDREEETEEKKEGKEEERKKKKEKGKKNQKVFFQTKSKSCNLTI